MLKKIFNISQKRYFHNFTNNNHNKKDKIIKTTLELINIYIGGFIFFTGFGGLYIYKKEYQYYYYTTPLNALFMSFMNASLPAAYWPIFVPLKVIDYLESYIIKKK